MNDTRGLTTILEGTIVELVRQVVKTVMAETAPSGDQAPSGARWMTPPQAARKTGISVKAIRNMIKEGVVQRRLRNISRRPTQAKYLVNVDEVAAVAANTVFPSPRLTLLGSEIPERVG